MVSVDVPSIVLGTVLGGLLTISSYFIGLKAGVIPGDIVVTPELSFYQDGRKLSVQALGHNYEVDLDEYNNKK